MCRQYGLNAVSDTRVIHNDARNKNIVLPCQGKVQRYLRIFFLAKISSPLLLAGGVNSNPPDIRNASFFEFFSGLAY